MSACWSIRVLFASALVLAFVGGEWHGRRDGEHEHAVLRDSFEFYARHATERQVSFPDSRLSQLIVSTGESPAEGPDEDRQWLCTHSMAYFRSNRACAAYFIVTSSARPGVFDGGVKIDWPQHDTPPAPPRRLDVGSLQ